MDVRAVVILYEGIKIPEKMLIKLAQILRKEKIANERNITISELDQNDITKTLVKTKVAESITFKNVVEKDPTEQAIIYLKGYFGDEVWINPVLFGVNLMGAKGNLTEEGRTALQILCREIIPNDIAMKYNFTKAHLTAIQAVVTSM